MADDLARFIGELESAEDGRDALDGLADSD